MEAGREPGLDGHRGGKKQTIACGGGDGVSEKGFPESGRANRSVKGYEVVNACADDARADGR